MSIPHAASIVRLVTRTLCLCLLLLPARFALAQESPAPISGKRLEELVRSYADVNEEELAAIRAQHETVFAGFVPPGEASRREFFPAQTAIEAAIAERDVFQRAIAEKENAFFEAIASLVAEDRRAGVARACAARERQRNLDWHWSFLATVFDSDERMIDLAELVREGDYLADVTDAQRGQFDALLAAQEQRLLSESRSYRSAVRKALGSWAEVARETGLLELANDAYDRKDFDEPEFQRRSSLVVAEMRRREPDALRFIATNAKGNAAAVRMLAAMLPERAALELRNDFAVRMSARSRIFIDTVRHLRESWRHDLSAAASPGDMLDFLVRQGSLTAEARASLESSDLEWRREQVAVVERAKEIVCEGDAHALWKLWIAWAESGQTPADGPIREIVSLARRLIVAEQRAYRAIASALDDETRERMFAPVVIEDERYRDLVVDPLVPRKGALRSSSTAGMCGPAASDEDDPTVQALPDDPVEPLEEGNPVAMDAGALAAIYRTIGVPPDSTALIEATVHAWREAEWEAKVAPVAAEVRSVSERAWYRPENADPVRNEEAHARLAVLRPKLLEAVLAADASLATMLSAALGWPADSPEILLLKLERVVVASGPRIRTAAPCLPALSVVLRAARIPPETARAVLAAAQEEWQSIVAEIPSRTRASFASAEQILQIYSAPASAPYGTEAYLERSMRANRVIRTSSSGSLAFVERFGMALDRSLERATDDADTRLVVKRAWLERVWPRVYDRSKCLSFELLAAKRIDGLSDTQLASAEALQAEYEAVHGMLSGKMVHAVNSAADAYLESGSHEAASVWHGRYEKIDSQRTELTQRTRADLRRVLGRELSERVEGLVVRSKAAQSRRSMEYDIFSYTIPE